MFSRSAAYSHKYNLSFRFTLRNITSTFRKNRTATKKINHSINRIYVKNWGVQLVVGQYNLILQLYVLRHVKSLYFIGRTITITTYFSMNCFRQSHMNWHFFHTIINWSCWQGVVHDSLLHDKIVITLKLLAVVVYDSILQDMVVENMGAKRK